MIKGPKYICLCFLKFCSVNIQSPGLGVMGWGRVHLGLGLTFYINRHYFDLVNGLMKKNSLTGVVN